MFPQWGFRVLWFLHGISNFGCFRGSWFLALAAYPAVIGLTLSLKLSTYSKNSPEGAQSSLLSEFTSKSWSASRLLLHIQVLLLNCGAHKRMWIAVRSQGIPHGWDGHSSQVWRHHREFHLFDFKPCSSSLLVGHRADTSYVWH